MREKLRFWGLDVHAETITPIHSKHPRAVGLSGGNATFDGPMTDQYCSQPKCAETEVLPNSYRAISLRTGYGVSLETRGTPWQLSLHNR
jgi:hypothetical protein